MGIEPPFLYDRTSQYSFTGPTEKGFNPKAVSQASWTPKPSRPKQEGPLINAKELNRHPDSYFVVPYGVLNWKPLNPNTKTKVKYTRWVQLFLRVLALLGAIGMLVCVICIKGTDNTLGWILRISPGITILHTVYAVYHLARSSKERTPASSGSYMLFAAIVDACIIPFIAFSAMISYTQDTEPKDTKGRWDTLFLNPKDTDIIIHSTFLISVVLGGLLFISLCLSIYLAIIFRKIAKLPPDMNPLEDNLTSRHKRNKSSISTAMTESISNRDSHVSAPLVDSSRSVPFMHTRTESSTSLSSPQRRPRSSNRPSRPTSYVGSPQNPGYNRLSTMEQTSPSTAISPKRAPAHSNPRPNSRPESLNSSASKDNWFTYPSPISSPSPPQEQIIPEFQHLRNPNIQPTLPNIQPVEFERPRQDKYNFANRTPRPLAMNPPTPPFAHQHRRGAEQRALTPLSGNSSTVSYDEPDRSATAGSYGALGRPHNASRDSFGVIGAKTRFYGDLHAGMVKETQGRTVSSGANFGEKGRVRAREVSGKVVEEGRGQAVFR